MEEKECCGWPYEEHASNFFHCDIVLCPEFIPQASQQYYTDVLQHLWENVQQKCPEKWQNGDRLVHHDNMPTPFYSLDLALCDLFLFPKIKLKLEGKKFNDVLEIQQSSQQMLNGIMKVSYCF
jgi:hypothetical protein